MSYKIGRLFGIQIYLHYTWFFIFFLLAYGLAAGFFPQYFPHLNSVENWTLGFASAFLLFVSVLAHELSHSVVAQRNGIRVDKITLFFFGGIAQISEEHINAKTELKMAIAGPAMSVLLGILFLIIYTLDFGLYANAITAYLWRINFILAAFNMFPGYPLDGGRVFRAIVWMITKDIKKATKYASIGGRGFAYILISFGFFEMFFTGSLSGLWLVFIGFFLLTVSKASYEQTIMREILSTIKVNDAMKKRFNKLSNRLTIRQAIEKILKFEEESLPIVDKDKLVGVVNLHFIQRVPKDMWSKTKITDVMIPAKMIKTISKESGAYSALMKMMKAQVSLLPVVEKGRLIGIISADSLLQLVKIKNELASQK